MPADAPRLDDLDCPRSWTWPEGPEQTLHCEARGNPEPSVHCARPEGGSVLALGLLGPVTRALAGTYRCTAVNEQGQAVKDVTLTVECESGEACLLKFTELGEIGLYGTGKKLGSAAIGKALKGSDRSDCVMGTVRQKQAVKRVYPGVLCEISQQHPETSGKGPDHLKLSPEPMCR